jgi:hypothetical protein
MKSAMKLFFLSTAFIAGAGEANLLAPPLRPTEQSPAPVFVRSKVADDVIGLQIPTESFSDLSGGSNACGLAFGAIGAFCLPSTGVVVTLGATATPAAGARRRVPATAVQRDASPRPARRSPERGPVPAEGDRSLVHVSAANVALGDERAAPSPAVVSSTAFTEAPIVSAEAEVPEPGNMAMILAGLGLMGLVAVRRTVGTADR